MISKKHSQKIPEVPTTKSILEACTWLKGSSVEDERCGSSAAWSWVGSLSQDTWSHSVINSCRDMQDNESHIKDSRTYPFITQILFCSLREYKVILIFQLICYIPEYKLNVSIPCGVPIYGMYGVCQALK